MMQRPQPHADIDVKEFADEMLEFAQMKNKATCTRDDPENDWAVVQNYELLYMKERVVMFRDYEKLTIGIEQIIGVDRVKAAKSAIWVGIKALLAA